MPTSFPEQIPKIIQTVNKLQPKSILDIGCGNGKYGFLLKEYFPEITIDAIEVFEPYIKKAHKENYRNITIGNALEAEVKPYDLYMIIDVLEHWQKEPAMALLRKLVEHGKVLVSTPRSVAPQGAEYGNQWETHVTQWLESDWDEFQREGIHDEFAFIQLLSKK
jgi:2-polyprenyl-3-methyl-5-hydroxy-6-metoxy-1,4-benzoquinol methylase